MDSYGKELILDLHHCEPSLFTRKIIREYFKRVCELIDMERGALYWWDDLNTPAGEKEVEIHLVGTSAVQFIKTSNITIHTLDLIQRVYLNVFSCKDFNEEVVAQTTATWFEGDIVNKKVIERK